jgi:hypothetical protein
MRSEAQVVLTELRRGLPPDTGRSPCCRSICVHINALTHMLCSLSLSLSLSQTLELSNSRDPSPTHLLLVMLTVILTVSWCYYSSSRHAHAREDLPLPGQRGTPGETYLSSGVRRGGTPWSPLSGGLLVEERETCDRSALLRWHHFLRGACWLLDHAGLPSHRGRRCSFGILGSPHRLAFSTILWCGSFMFAARTLDRCVLLTLRSSLRRRRRATL